MKTYFYIAMDDLILMQVAQSFQNLSGVEDNRGLFQRTPLRPEQGRETTCMWRESINVHAVVPFSTTRVPPKIVFK